MSLAIFCFAIAAILLTIAFFDDLKDFANNVRTATAKADTIVQEAQMTSPFEAPVDNSPGGIANRGRSFGTFVPAPVVGFPYYDANR